MSIWISSMVAARISGVNRPNSYPSPQAKSVGGWSTMTNPATESCPNALRYS